MYACEEYYVKYMAPEVNTYERKTIPNGGHTVNEPDIIRVVRETPKDKSSRACLENGGSINNCQNFSGKTRQKIPFMGRMAYGVPLMGRRA